MSLQVRWWEMTGARATGDLPPRLSGAEKTGCEVGGGGRGHRTCEQGLGERFSAPPSPRLDPQDGGVPIPELWR